MHATVKGALAAGAAGTLLLGGAGTLAYWNGNVSIGGGTITAGDLKLDSTNCTAATWTVSNATVSGGASQAFTLGTDRIVPGDVLTKTCTIAITAVGKNLKANLAVTDGVTTGTDMNTADYSVGGAFTLNSTPAVPVTTGTPITSANTGQTVTATITVTFPLRAGTADNSSMLKHVDLSAYTVTATQVLS
jgi:alternate signal-mediated exported protein